MYKMNKNIVPKKQKKMGKMWSTDLGYASCRRGVGFSIYILRIKWIIGWVFYVVFHLQGWKLIKKNVLTLKWYSWMPMKTVHRAEVHATVRIYALFLAALQMIEIVCWGHVPMRVHLTGTCKYVIALLVHGQAIRLCIVSWLVEFNFIYIWLIWMYHRFHTIQYNTSLKYTIYSSCRIPAVAGIECTTYMSFKVLHAERLKGHHWT